MSLIEAIAYALVAVTGTAVVVTRRPVNQLMVFTAFGATLSLLFFVLHAPDVAFSEIAVGTLVIPLAVLITLMKTRGGA